MRFLCGLTALTLGFGPVFAQQPVSTQAPNQVAVNTDPKTPPPPTDEKAVPKPDRKPGEAVTAEELNEMRMTIKLLSERVRELEDRLNRAGAGPAGGTAATTTGAPAATAGGTALPASVAGLPGNAPAANTGGTVPVQEPKDPNGFTSMFRNTEISGFIDAYYGFNNNRPANTTNPQDIFAGNLFRNFDSKHNQMNLNMVKLVVASAPTTEQRLGYRFDFTWGQGADLVHLTEPGANTVRPGQFINYDPSPNFLRNVQQAYFSYLAPIGKGLQFDVGKFVTHSGYELIESKDNWNYSRSFIFTLGPFYHFGAKATYAFNDKFSLMAGVTNGWNNVIDNNGYKTVIAQAVWKPTSKFTFIQNYTGGPEEPNNVLSGDANPMRQNKRWRNLFDTNFVWNVHSKVDVAANYIYGFDSYRDIFSVTPQQAFNPNLVPVKKVNWTGVAGYARFKFTDNFSMSPRFEYFYDRDGAFYLTGIQNNKLKEFTLTSDYTKSGFTFRAEYRRDFSNQQIFPRFNAGQFLSFRGNQNTFTIGLIYAFTLKSKPQP
jgi:hypothetical protein